MLTSNLVKKVILHGDVKLRNDERCWDNAGMMQGTCH